MSKVLIQFAHPAYSKSRVHKILVKHIAGIDKVTFNDLYELYPDLYIDVKREQKLLLEHDIILFQHPFYWYSGPAIIKQWMDLVLEFNWAYGPEGKALAGKKWLNVVSCGTRQEAYTDTGFNMHTVSQFLLPFRQTATLCRMEFLPPFVIHGTHRMTADMLEPYGRQYNSVLKGLVADSLSAERLKVVEYINDLLVKV